MSKTISFTTSKGKQYSINAQVLTPNSYPRILEFSTDYGRTLIHVTYSPNDGPILDDEFLIRSGFDLLKNAAEIFELGTPEFYEYYSTQRILPAFAVMEFEIGESIREQRRVKVILERDKREFEGVFQSRSDETATLEKDGSFVTIALADILDIQPI